MQELLITLGAGLASKVVTKMCAKRNKITSAASSSEGQSEEKQEDEEQEGGQEKGDKPDERDNSDKRDRDGPSQEPELNL